MSVNSMIGTKDGTTATSVESWVGVLVGATVGVTCGKLEPQPLINNAHIKTPTIRLYVTNSSPYCMLIQFLPNLKSIITK